MIILIISVLFCLDLFIRAGRPSTFDGPTHLTNIAQFTKALRSGDFPVRWMDGFANYGMPMAVIVQQTTAYLGAFFTLIFNNVILSYNLVIFIGTFLSLYFLYKFLRLHFSENASLLAVILFNFAPYRIINVYIRGALPEFFSHVFFPLVFMGLYYWIYKRKNKGLCFLLVGLVGILLTHPFTLIIGSFLFAPYTIWLLWEKKQNPFKARFIIPLILVALLSFGVTAYYILPLFSEIKFFYYGQSGAGFRPDQYLTYVNYVSDSWFYFTKNDIDVRGHVIQLGVLELVLTGIGFLIWLLKKRKPSFMGWVFVSFMLLVFLTFSYANPLYKAISLLGGIQYNWRMFASIVFIAPFVVAFIYDSVRSKLFFYGIILLVVVLRFPQIYGKNYLQESQQAYYWTKVNLHGNILNTVWTGPTEDYPIKRVKGEIISGTGKIIKRTEQNSRRIYTIQTTTDVRMVDNTFYFPGWKVYVDGKSTPIEFQDMNYRGVITYMVPSGTHTVLVKFEETKIRLLGDILSLLSIIIIIIIGIIIFKRKSSLHHPSQKSA